MDGAEGNGTAEPADMSPERSPETATDIPRDTRWLSYRELAEVLAPIKLESVVRLVRRKRWTKRSSNNGVRIAVPADFLADVQRRHPAGRIPDAARTKPTKPADHERAGYIASIREDHARERAGWAEQMASVRADVERERSRADRLEAEVVELRTRADRAEGMAEGLRVAHAQVPPGRLVVWLRSLLRSLREAFRP